MERLQIFDGELREATGTMSGRNPITSRALWVLPAVMVCTRAFAECQQDFPPYIAEIPIASCQVLGLEELKQMHLVPGLARMTIQEQQEILEQNRGALVTGKGGTTYQYFSKSENVCDKFPQGTTVKMVVETPCCDTGVGCGQWLRDTSEHDPSRANRVLTQPASPGSISSNHPQDRLDPPAPPSR